MALRLALLLLRLPLGFALAFDVEKQLIPIARRSTEYAIEDRIAQSDDRQTPSDVLHDDHAGVLFWQKRNLRAEAVDRASVGDERLAAIVLHHPAQPVRFEIRLRIRFFAEALDSNHCLRCERLLQRRGGDQTFPVDRAAGELESKPLRHVANARFD